MGYMDKNIFVVKNLDPKTISRLFSKIYIDKITGCWNWTGNLNQTGYGRIRYLGNKVLVHRLMYSWIMAKPLSKTISRNNLILDHICNNKKCCNPKHLRLTTHKINMLRGNGPSAREARQTHCKRGHLLPIKKNSSGRRFCQICNTMWARKRYRLIHKITPDKFKV
jgi:hypothetical protein